MVGNDIKWHSAKRDKEAKLLKVETGLIPLNVPASIQRGVRQRNGGGIEGEEGENFQIRRFGSSDVGTPTSSAGCIHTHYLRCVLGGV